MKYYVIYQLLFPMGLAVAAPALIAGGTLGLIFRRPLVISSPLVAFIVTAILVPVFFLSTNHLYVPPIADTWRCWLLNFFGALGCPALALWGWGWSNGCVVFGHSREKVEAALAHGAEAANSELGKLRIHSFGKIPYVIIRRGKDSKISSSAIQEALNSLYKEAHERAPYQPFFVMLLAGLALLGTSFGTWCFAAQCWIP